MGQEASPEGEHQRRQEVIGTSEQESAEASSEVRSVTVEKDMRANEETDKTGLVRMGSRGGAPERRRVQSSEEEKGLRLEEEGGGEAWPRLRDQGQGKEVETRMVAGDLRGGLAFQPPVLAGEADAEGSRPVEAGQNSCVAGRNIPSMNHSSTADAGQPPQRNKNDLCKLLQVFKVNGPDTLRGHRCVARWQRSSPRFCN